MSDKTKNFQETNTLAYFAAATVTEKRVLFTPPGVDLIKLFWHEFTFSFYKLDIFVKMQQI